MKLRPDFFGRDVTHLARIIGTTMSRGEDAAAGVFANPPVDFLCPISLEVMTDPVVAADGFTYDRASMQEWLAGGNATSPKTGAPLPKEYAELLIPNNAVRKLIASWRKECEAAASVIRPELEMLQAQIACCTRNTGVDKEEIKKYSKMLADKVRHNERRQRTLERLQLFAQTPRSNAICAIDPFTPEMYDRYFRGNDQELKAMAFRVRGAVLLSFGNHNEDAITNYELAIDQTPWDPVLAGELAEIYRSFGLDSKAREVTDAALRTNPGHPGLLVSRGLSLQLEGRGEEALEMFTEAVTQEPENAAFRERLAECRCALGFPEEDYYRAPAPPAVAPRRHRCTIL